MYQHQSNEDTISAIITPVGPGGVGIVRLSGPQALVIADSILKLKSAQLPSKMKTFTMSYGWVMEDGNVLDEVLVSVMRAPRSYTMQDVVEISTHASRAIVQAVLELTLKKGARLAQPGEFTKRAFLNGRIDLSQAEAVLDVINAKTKNFARISTNQLDGKLSREIESIRENLLNTYTAIEALINFPEDDIDAQQRGDLQAKIDEEKQRIDYLCASAANGRIFKEGMRIVLCGKPNVGKSSLLNALLKVDRAIVSEVAGTTRDVIEESAQIDGIPFQLVDTAGILEPRDRIEAEAVKRSHVLIQSADVVLLVLDSSRPLEQADFELMNLLSGRRVVVVLNKNDLPNQIDVQRISFAHQLGISVLKHDGIDRLEKAIVENVLTPTHHDPGAIIVTNARHVQALRAASERLEEACMLANQKAAWEIVSFEIKEAVNLLDAITGRNIDADLLEKIFSAFCIGK